MPSKKLTQGLIDDIKPPGSGRLELHDQKQAGLVLRLTAEGAASWCVRYRTGGKSRRYTFGSLAAFPKLEQARERAAEIIRIVEKGGDPAAAKAARREGEDEGAVGHAIKIYLAQAKKQVRPRSYDEIERLLNEAGEVWKGRPLEAIGKRDVMRLLDRKAETAPVASNRQRAVLSKFFNWSMQRDLIQTSPIIGTKPVGREAPRERVLSDDEVRWFWTAASKIQGPFSRLFKLLLVVGQRRSEVGGMEWRELDLDAGLWIIPKERAKNAREHRVALSPLARQIIGEIDAIEGVPFVFTSTGETPVSGFSKTKARLDQLMERARADDLGLPPPEPDALPAIPQWRLHDLRRTVATGMGKLGVAPHTIDAVLNHVSGTMRGVTGIYNRSRYEAEKAAALTLWSSHLARLVGIAPPAENATDLAAKR